MSEPKIHDDSLPDLRKEFEEWLKYLDFDHAHIKDLLWRTFAKGAQCGVESMAKAFAKSIREM